ncbi:MAG: tripartite tricarboxylate transporter TctB family protein [Clostridiaceae bacterium]|nr:tripartite tricarboxylate transporter TctB family protein [Clostridiaceae bacterium]
MKKKDRLVGCIIVILGIIISLAALQIPDKSSATDPGSRLFPMIGSFGMIIFGSGIFLTAKDKEDFKPAVKKGGWARLAKIVIVFILYTIALKLIGFLISTPFMMYALVALFSYEKKIPVWKNALFSIAVSGVIWFVFVKLLTVMLPAGTLL